MTKGIGCGLGLLLCFAGAALAQPGIAVQPAALNYGEVQIGSPVDGFVVVTNPGNTALDVNASVTGDEFILWSAVHFVIPAGDTTGCPVTVRCMPFAPFQLNGILHLRMNCPVDSHVVIPLRATGSHNPDPAEFDLAAPADSSHVSGESLALAWTTLSMAEPVTYCVRVVPPAGAMREFRTTDTTLTVATSALTGEGWYEWWVDAEFSMGLQGSDSRWDFHFSANPPLPTEFHLLSPADEAGLYQASQSFVWQDAAPGIAGVGYALEIAGQDSSGEPFRRTYWTTDTSHTVSFLDFEWEAVYGWWVDAYIEFDTLRSVEQWQFFLTNIAADEPRGQQPARLSIASVYPNPFNPETRITLWVPQAGPVRAEVFDLLGRSVGVLIDAPLAAGEHTFRWEAKGATGTYLLRLSDARGAVAVQRLVVVR